MHYCPDCGEECNCSCDYEKDSDNCEHVCKTPEDVVHDKDIEEGMFEDYCDDMFDDEDF